jgi:ubiquinone/menaquinone biosynthesis C-methylase UbiE
MPVTRAAFYDQLFAGLGADSLVHDLHRRALGTDHPEGIDVFSLCTNDTLEQALAQLRMPPGGVLVDLGCGLGGPGRWLARHGGTRLIGIDFSRVALRLAAGYAAGYLGTDRFTYQHGTFAATGLPDACADGAVSIDAFPMAGNHGVALRELRRILRPGARAFLTCGEQARPGDTPDRIAGQWAALIERAGLVLADAVVDQCARERWLTIYGQWLSHEAELRERLADTAEELLREAREAPGSVLGPGFRALWLTVAKRATDHD